MLYLPFTTIYSSMEPIMALTCVAYLTAKLAQLPSVHFLALRSKHELLNYRARSIQQTAKISSDLSNAIYSAAGLLGDGQVIGIADTGVDSFSCYFYDPQGQVRPTDVSSPSFDLKYRKIVQYDYNGCGDTSDGEGGHGTHVSGIVAGNKINADINSNGQYDGVAPNAKISFGDYGKPGTGLCIPSVNQLYGAPHSAGAYTFTNSWGSYFAGTNYYTGSDQDGYLFRNQVGNNCTITYNMILSNIT